MKNHYESAFKEYLRAKSLPFVAVDESQRASFGAKSPLKLKSFDFVVYSSGGANLLVDVKGRKFPDSSAGGGKKSQARAWENWVTRSDIEGLSAWEKVFGDGFLSVLVFAYWLQGPPERSPFDDVYIAGEKQYAFLAITLAKYLTLAKPRSQKWQTIDVPAGEFSRQARDVSTFL